MFRVLWNSTSGMMASQNKLDAISNNLANVDTEGYKRVTVNFKDLVYETLNRQGYPISENNNRAQEPFTGTGVRTGEWTRDFKQGSLKETGNKTDIAIDGDGFFRITKGDGSVVYSRAGLFNIDPASGRLVDNLGNVLEINYNPGVDPKELITKKDNLNIGSNGIITVEDKDKSVEVGRIPIYSFIGKEGLQSVGDSYYVAAPENQIYESQDFALRQGFVEKANVDVADEFQDMIITQRAFELNSRGIKTADEMWGMINNLRGK